MAKQLNVDMRFTADTSKAKQAINDLEQSLAKLGHGAMPQNAGINSVEFEKASAAARELEFHLKNAYNAKTGNLDLSKLTSSLNASKTNLKDLTSSFANAGTAGQQAFVNLARAIATADQPSLTLNTHLSTMLITLKNVARFQISSSIMHGLIGGIQTAYGYAQDLNESLNNIRIVTGQSTSQMARFAEQANKGAKALSATTLDYTNASLIYYQQGLDDEAVRERTEVTLKMANVARESAETVSEQMTAIWNNFDDGSKSLEYYADVITALGAATASSSSEISTGLNKFAAVANTVGLSYENATAALATITATTRQSADTIGTGLRTLFSRLQGLSLGETLEDGVNLNKYSQALAKVGVQALDSSGNLRRMDEVLEDLGKRWRDLTKAQQTALAQTVGGVRQYTTLVALMDNWDFMKQNQEVAANAGGTLQKQADIYAESWEAARDRVRAAAESIYDALIDDEFFIGIADMIEQVLTGVKSFIDSFGGVKSIVTAVLSFAASMLASKIGPAFQKIIQDIQILSGGANKVYDKMQSDFQGMVNNELSKQNADGSDVYNVSQKAELEGVSQLLAAKTKLSAVNDKLSISERMRAELAISGIEQQIENIKKLAQEVENAEKKKIEAEEERDKLEKQIQSEEEERERKKLELNKEAEKKQQEAENFKQREITYSVDNVSSSTLFEKAISMKSSYDGESSLYNTDADIEKLNQLIQQAEQTSQTIREKFINALTIDPAPAIQLIDAIGADFKDKLTNLIPEDGDILKLDKSKGDLQILMDGFGDLSQYAPDIQAAFEQALNAETVTQFESAIENLNTKLEHCTVSGNNFRKVLKAQGISDAVIRRYEAALKDVESAQKKLIDLEKQGLKSSQAYADAVEEAKAADEAAKTAKEDLAAAQDKINKTQKDFKPEHTTTFGEGIIKGAAALGQTITLINSVKSAFTTLGDDSATAGEKITAVLMAFSMGIPAVVGMINNFKEALAGIRTGLMTLQAAQKAYQAIQAVSISLTATEGQLSTKEGQAKIAEALASTKLVGSKMAEAIARNLTIAAQMKGSKLTAMEIVKTVLLTALKGGEAGAHIANTGAIEGETGAVLGLETVLAPLLIIVGLFIVALTALVAIGYGVVAVIKLMSNIYNADALAAQQAANAAKELAEAYDEAKQAYEDLKQSIENYQTAREAIDNLTVGTREWRDAITEANEKALELINTYGLISGQDYTVDSNGLITIKQTSLDNAIAEAGNKKDTLFAASQSAQVSANVAQATADQTALKREYHVFGTDANTAIRNMESDQRIDRAIAQLTTGDLAEAFKRGSLSDEELKQKLNINDDELISAIKDLANTINQNSDQQEATANIIAKTALADKGYNDAAVEIASEAYEKRIDEIKKEIYDTDNKITKWASANNKDVQDIWQRYQAATGTNYKLSTNAVQGFSGGQNLNSGRNYEYVDDEGNKKLVNIETMASAIAASEALKELGASAQKASAILGKIKINENAGYSSSDINDYIATGNFENSTAESINAIQGAIDKAGSTQNYLEGILGGEENLKALADLQGIDVETFVKNFENSLNSIDFNSIGTNFVDSVANAINNDREVISNATYKTQEGIANLYNSTFVNLGKEGLDTFSNIIGNLSKEGKLKDFEQIASNFDWASGSTDEFKQRLIEAGIAVNNLDLDPWINGMLQGKQVLMSIDEISKNYGEIHKIIDSLKIGDTITQEQFKMLGEGVENYFTRMTDGTYKLTGDAEEFYNIVNGNSIEQIKKRIERQEQNKETLTAIQEQGYTLNNEGPNSLKTEAGHIVTYNGHRYVSNASIDTDKAQAQIDFLKTQDFKDETGMFQEIQEDLTAGNTLTLEQLEFLANSVKSTSAAYNDLTDAQKANAEGLDQARVAAATTARTVGELQDRTVEFKLTNDEVNEGYKNLATSTDEGKAALELYNQELKLAGKDTAKIEQATKKFQKTIKDIQANKAAENIRKLGKNLDELTDVDLNKVAVQLQSVFGKEVTADFIKHNKELVNQWLNGIDEERQAAADSIETMTDMIGNLDDLSGAISNNDKITIPVDFDTSKLSMEQQQIELFKQIIRDNPPTVDVNGHADMSEIVQRLLEAGMTAEQVAGLLASISNTEVEFQAGAFNLGDFPANGTPTEIKNWMKDFSTQMGNIGLNVSHFDVPAGGKPNMTSGGGGGGGGGGGNKQKEKKDPTDERDRYHTITEKIQDATDAYDELSKAEDRAFGKERIKAMEGITNNLKLQIELQKQYLDEIRNYLEGDRAAVEALGATFDANGVITNYDDLIAELVAKYNEGVDAFNNGGLDEDAFKEQYEEPFNDAKKAIDQYVETINLLQSEELNLIDLQNDLADQLREIAAYKLELHIDIDEDELKYLDFLLEMLGENAEDAVDRLDLLGQQFNTNRDEIAAYTTAIQNLLRLRGFTDEDVAAFIRGELTAGDLEKRGFTTDDIDKLREYRDAIQDNTTAMNDLAKEIEESFLNTLDDLNEKVDDAEERFEHFAAMLEHFHNVVDIVGQDALGMSAETMKLLAKAAKENAIEMVKAAKTQLDSLNSVRAQAQAQLDAALEAQKNASTAEEKLRADEAVRYWSDTINEVTNRVEQAEEDLADALENALEGIQEMYTTMIEQATKGFERSVTGAAGSLEQLQKNFDRQKETQELYIPTYEKIYELTKLTRDINNSIDDTDNLWSKQELAKLQDEINQKMEDGVELTEHDVEELRKRYELKLAEAALEEAQDAKRTVRMSRDNEGNWSYVYTADENDVAEAEQNYEDKLYEYQQMNYEYIQDLQANIIQAQQDMADAINDLDAASFASQEEYLAEVQRIRDAAMAKISQYRDQLAQTLEQQGILYEEDWKRYNELTCYRMARDDQWVDNWNETILAQETGFETLEDMFDQITGAIGGPDEPGTYVGDITDAYAEMQASNERALNAAGTSMQTYEQDTVNAIGGIDQQMEETQNQIDEFTNSMTEAMEGVSDFIGEWKNQYGEAVKSITEFNKDLYDSCNTLIKKLQDAYGVNADFEAAQAEAAAEALAGSQRGNSKDTSKGESPDNNNSGNTTPINNYTTTREIVYEDYGDWTSSGPIEHSRKHNIYYSDKTHETVIDTGIHNRNKRVNTGKYDTCYCSVCGQYMGQVQKYKTGGYTGTWSAASARTGMYTGSWNGPDLEENGRLAFLHQKELVLNASDTENFLSAVDMVRQISQTIDLQAASRSNGWNFLLPGILGRGPDTLDQNVHIEAHFPNVTSHSEIEEAFTNLVGKASQFANR